jgi:hypothetical protein
MKVRCNICNQLLCENDFEISTDSAQCPKCDNKLALSVMLRNKVIDSFDLNCMPKGTWLKRKPDHFRFGAYIFHPLFILMLPFLIFLIIAESLFISKLEFNLLELDTGIAVLMLIQTIMFLFLTGSFLVLFFGKTEVILNKDGKGIISEGIGCFRLTKHFNLSDIRNIFDSRRPLFSYVSSEYPNHGIVIKRKKIIFGNHLSNERRYYILMTLQKLARDIAMP